MAFRAFSFFGRFAGTMAPRAEEAGGGFPSVPQARRAARSWSSAPDPSRRERCAPLLDAGARVTVVAPDVVEEIAALAAEVEDRPPAVRARRRRRRLVRGRGGAARGQSRGRARGRGALPLRQRRRRPGERERVCRRDRAEGGRHDRDVDRWRGAGARGPDARGARGAAARGTRLWMACAQDARREWLAQRRADGRAAADAAAGAQRPLRTETQGQRRAAIRRMRYDDAARRTRLRLARRRRARRSRSADAQGGAAGWRTRTSCLYDALVDPATLELAPTAQRVYVGKRAGRPQVRQEFIHWLMIRAARAGKKVVRLKGGDPFVFGRGGEEGLALAAAGIAFEVVPGVSSAIAAARARGHPGDPSRHRRRGSSWSRVTPRTRIARCSRASRRRARPWS